MPTKDKAPIARKNTYKIDDLTNTKLDWLLRFSKAIGIPAPTQRMMISRAIDFYVEYMDELTTEYNCQPKSKDVNREREELLRAAQERPSVWNSPDIPEVYFDEDRHMFPRYSYLVDTILKKPPPRLPTHITVFGKRLPCTPMTEEERLNGQVSVSKRKRKGPPPDHFSKLRKKR